MRYTFLWAYIIIIIITGPSVFSSLLIYKKNNNKWFLDYLKLLIAVSILVFLQIAFYLITNIYTVRSVYIDNVRMATTSLLFAVTSYFYCSLAYAVLEQSLNGLAKKLFLFGALGLNAVLAIILFFFHKNGYNLVNIPLIVISFACDMKLVYNWRTLFKQKKEKILIYFFLASIVIKILFYTEFIIQRWLQNSQATMPDRSAMYVVYYLGFHVINLIYSFKILRVSSPVSIGSHTEDIPPNFIKAFLITNKEKEVLEYIVKGYNNKDISQYLYRSIRTIDTHVYNIYQKCRINNRVELLNLIREYQ